MELSIKYEETEGLDREGAKKLIGREVLVKDLHIKNWVKRLLVEVDGSSDFPFKTKGNVGWQQTKEIRE
jgi:hypothetical protein